MKLRFAISRYYSITIPLYLLFLSAFVACQDYVSVISNPLHIPIQLLSERGKTYFDKEQYAALEVAHRGVTPVGYKLGEYDGVEVNFHRGTFTGKTTGGNYTVTGGTDMVSIINFVPAAYEVVCRCIDINGWYYRHDKAEYIEDFLYAVDRARHEIYIQNSSDYYSDTVYLQTKIYDFEVLIAACGNKKSAWRDACIEVRDTLIRSLKFIESQYNHAPEQQYKLKQQVLKHAIEKVYKTKFKNKKDKQRLLTEYQDALADEEKQYCAYQVGIVAQQIRQKELQQQQHIQHTFDEQFSLLEDEMHDGVIYAAQMPLFSFASEMRAEVFDQSRTGVQAYCTETYVISDDVQALLKENNTCIDTFTFCYGNHYQQRLHQESLAILEHTSQIPIGSVFYEHQHTLVTFAEVAAEYNHAGECHKSVHLLDFCWTLLSWGTQIVTGAAEGAALGVIGAVTDIIEHPVETGVSLVLGSSVMLTYQLSKIVYTVADLSITRLVDPVAGKQKWNSYLEPLNAVIDAIDKKQIGLKDVSKAVTQFGVQWYTQAKLLGGLRNLYDGIKTKAIAYIKSNATADLNPYLGKPDGTLMKLATDALDPVRSNGISSLHWVTANGRIACDGVFPISDVIRNIFTQSSNLLTLSCNTKQLKLGLTGIATVLNTQLEKNNGRESMAALLARLQKEAEACGSSSSPGPKKDDDEKDRYKGPKYNNMDELAEKEPFGKRLLNNIEKIKGAEYKGRQGYRVINDMPDLGIKSGDKLYLDSFHGDHIEVFKAGPKGSLPRQVISVDGRILVEKLNKAKADKRKCPF